MSLPYVIHQGTPAYRNYRLLGRVLLVLLIVAAGFIFAETWAPVLFDNKYTFGLKSVFGPAVYWAVGILALNIVTGHSGQLSLGHSFFIGTGAYTTAVLVAEYNWSYLATLAVAIPLCFVLGLLIGLPALRIKGLYLAVVTLGLSVVFPQIIRLDALTDLTGGSNGKDLNDFKLRPPSWLSLGTIVDFLQGLPVIGGLFGSEELSQRQGEALYKYLLLVIMAAITFWLVRGMLQSRTGRAFRAIRDNETGAAVSGVNLSIYKTLAFGISAAVAGIAGVMYTMHNQVVSPDQFSQTMALFLVVGLVIGGIATNSGAVIGGVLIVLIPHLARLTKNLPFSLPFIGDELKGPYGGLILGVMLIAITFALPGGISHGVRQVWRKIVQIVPAPPVLVEDTTTS